MAKPPKKPVRRTKEGADETAFLTDLSRCLSEAEIRRVLAVSLLALDESGRKRLVARLEGDTAATLGRLLEARAASGGSARGGTARGRGARPGVVPPSPGRGKIQQEWKQAWEEWESRIAESQHEDGEYVHQDEHWEPPYLDLGSLSDDLDGVAQRMRPLLAQVIERDLAPGFSFEAALTEAAEEMGAGLPEWIESAGGEGCQFGPEVSGCLLEWEWRSGRRRGEGAFAFAERICRLGASLRNAWLDADSLVRFILKLGEAGQRDILQGIAARRAKAPWAEALGEAHGAWFRVYQDLCRKWDRTRYLETCRDKIAEKWDLSLPLLRDLIRQKAFEAAVPLLDEAVRAMLHLEPGSTWDPRQSLLVRHSGWWYRGESAAARQLLELWRKVAVGLGQSGLVCALEIQAVVVGKAEDWDAVLDAFRRPGVAAQAEIIERLFTDWRRTVSARTLGGSMTGEEGGEEGWLDALLDTARAGGPPAAFQEAVRGCLREMERSPVALARSERSLKILTRDVDPGGELKRMAPTLHRLLANEGEHEPEWARARRGWVKRLRGTELFPEVIELWKRNAQSLVPDPARETGSRYGHCAEWLQAILELDPQVYQRIVESWAVIHKRRRNLWEALAKRKLPLPSSR